LTANILVRAKAIRKVTCSPDGDTCNIEIFPKYMTEIIATGDYAKNIKMIIDNTKMQESE